MLNTIVIALALLLGTITVTQATPPEPAGGIPIPQQGSGINNAQ